MAHVTIEQVEAVNGLLDYICKEHGLENDNQLARHLGLSWPTIDRIRKGETSRSTLALAPAAFQIAKQARHSTKQDSTTDVQV